VGLFYKLKTSKMIKDFKFLKGTTETICCFCGVEITDGGNDPDPIITDNPTDRCCDSCNLERVVAARIMRQPIHIVNKIQLCRDAGLI
jgi:hypothetical protein